MHKSAETVAMQFLVCDPTTGGLVNADSLPTGTLILNGVNNAAEVAVANIATGVYSASVTLPTVTDGDELQLRVSATVGGVSGGGIIWQSAGCTKRPADVFTALPSEPLDSAETQAAAAAAIAEAGLALEATLTAIKGAGWTTETLKAIHEAAAAVKVVTDKIGSPAMLEQVL